MLGARPSMHRALLRGATVSQFLHACTAEQHVGRVTWQSNQLQPV